jgi:hypothetical protein
VRWSPELDGGATAPEPKTTLKSNLFTSNLIIFSCLFQIRNPKNKKAYQSTGSEKVKSRWKLPFFLSASTFFSFPFSSFFRFLLLIFVLVSEVMAVIVNQFVWKVIVNDGCSLRLCGGRCD